MNPTSQELPNLNFTASQATFDPNSQSLILSDPSHLVSYNLPTQTVSSKATWSLPSSIDQSLPAEPAGFPLNTSFLRFTPAYSKSKIHISPSGLIATNQGQAEEIAIGNIGFKTGIHYWEIICPKHCKNIHVGVIQEGWSSNNPAAENNLIQANTFKTSTPRVIGLRLDLIRGELRFWLNRNFQVHKTINNLAHTIWYPCVKLKEPGTHVILNPFAIDPDSSYPIYEPQNKLAISQIKSTLSLYVLVSGFEKLQEGPVKLEGPLLYETTEGRFEPVEHNIDESGSIVAFRFKTPADAESFQKANQGRKHNNKNLIIFDNLRLLSCVLEVLKTNKEIKSLFSDKQTATQYTKMLSWALRCLPYFCNYHQNPESESPEHQENLNQFQTLLDTLNHEAGEVIPQTEESSLPSQAPINDISVKFIPRSDALLASHGNLIKLLHRENGKYNISPGTFNNRPKTPKDEVILTINRDTVKNILTTLDFKTYSQTLSRNKSTLQAFIQVFRALQAAYTEKATSVLTFKVQYKHAKIFVNGISGALITSIKWLKALLNSTCDLIEEKSTSVKPPSTDPHFETEVLLPFEGLIEPPIRDKPAKPEKKCCHCTSEEPSGTESSTPKVCKICKRVGIENMIFKNITFNQILQLLQSLLVLDETLYAMSLHEEASDKLKKYWISRKPRLFTAFARLGSLLNFPGNKYSLVELAEAGLYNTQDLLFELRHFLEPERRVDELQNTQEDIDLWTLLKKTLPENRMVQGYPCENVPLSVSLNNLPAQPHNYKEQDNIAHIATNPQTSIVASVSNSGEVKLWNTEFALVNLGHANFREEQGKVEGAPSVPSKKDPLSEDNVFDGLDVDEFKPSDVSHVQPDQGMVDTLYSMGFPVRLAKKALSLTKNAGIAVAVEKILALQEEEKVEKAESPEKGLQPRVKQIKPQWDCQACTFVNSNNSKLCEICGTPAPEEAYFTEEELSTPKETEKVIDPSAKEEEIPDTKKNFLEHAKVHSSILLPVESSPLSPVIVGVLFEEGKPESEGPRQYQLRFKRFIYSQNYIKKFIKKENNKGYSNLISGTWFSLDSKEPQEHLTRDYGLTFRALDPIFIGNNRYSDPKKEGKHSLFNGDLVQFDHADLTIESAPGTLLACVALPPSLENNKEVSRLALIWKNQEKLSLQQVSVSVRAAENLIDGPPSEHSLAVKEFANNDLALNGTFLSAEVLQDKFIISTDLAVHVYDANKLDNQLNSINLPFKPTLAQPLTPQSIAYLGDGGKTYHILQLDKEAANTTAAAVPKQHSSQSRKTQDLPNIQDLKDKELDVLRQILHKRALPANNPSNALTLSSNPLVFAGNSTKFYQPIPSPYSPQTLDVSFTHPSSLISIELSLQLNYIPSNPLKTKDSERSLLTDLNKLQTSSPESSGSGQPRDSALETTTAIQKISNQLPALNLSDVDSEGKFLPLTVSWYQGAAFNDSFPVSKIIAPNNDVFCANYGNSEFLFEHLHGKSMLIKSFTVCSKFKPIGSCGFPIGSGLIFTANFLSHLNIPAKFQNMTHQQYLQWLSARSQSSDELEPWEPVGSFELDGNSESITVDLQYVRPCKYILLRPTNMRTKPENFSHQFKNSPVEIKFFGVSGTTVSPSESDEITPKPILDNSAEYLRIKDSIIEVQAQNEDGQWIDIQKLENIQVQEIIDRQHTRTFLKLGGQWNVLSRIPLSGLSRQEVSGERLAQLKVNQLRVRVTQAGENLDRWVIAGVGVQAFAPLNAEAFLDLDFSPAVLRKAMLDSREFERFNKELVLELNRESVSPARKEKIVALISDIISAESTLCPLFYSHFDLKKFLLSSVLSQQNFSFKESQSLLRHFSCLKSFENNLLESTLQILPNLSTAANVTPAGLNGFFTMLTWCQRLDPAKIFNYMLKELHEVSKRIAQLRAPEYNILRTFFNIKGLVLEKELFRETSTISKKSSSKKSKDENEKRKQNVPLKAKILSYNSNDVDEYLINLGQNTQVDEIRLAFEQNNKTIKFRVQIWAVLPGQASLNKSQAEESKEQESQGVSSFEPRPIKKLLHSKAYNESTWIQLSNYAYDRQSNESNFGPTEELECLGYSNLNVTTKYLVVQITYSLLPLMQGNPEKNDKKPMPEVYGRIVDDDSSTNEVPELLKLFDTSKVTYKSSVKFPHTVKYEKCEVANKNAPYKHMLGPVGTITNQVQDKPASDEASTAPKVNTKALTEKLDKLQSELCSRLALMKAGPPTPQSKDEIKNLCKEIKICQSKLYNARETHTATDAEQPAPTTFLAHPEKSLDYLYTIAQKLSQSLRKIDSATAEESKAWRKDVELRGEKGRNIALEIFEYLIAYELSTTSKEFTSLLSEVLVHNLKPNEWQQFVINIINNFLTNSNAIPTQENTTMSMIPPQKIYSPAKIIQALDKISIPTGELLSFLTGKLEIPIGLPEATDKKKTRSATQKLSAEEESSTLSTLASILLLLNSSFKKVQPSETGDLTPPGMRRSISSKSKEGKEEPAVATQRVENIVEIKKFNHEESLQAAFYICIWICENPSLSDTDKSHVLALGLDLVLQIMKFAKVSGIRDLLRDPNSFLKLFMSTLKLTSPVLLTKFQGLLNAFLNPKQFSKKKTTTPEVQTPDEDALAEETKMLLVHHLQTILKWLLSYALNLDQPSSALPRRDDIAPSVWLEHICFILEFLLLAADKITVDPKKESNKTLTKKKLSERKKSMMTEEQREKYLMEDDATLLRPGMPRSMSMSQESKSKDPGSMINLDELDKSTTIPLDSIMQLIALLSTKTAARSGFNLSHSTKAWSLLMKAILKVKVATLVEGNIFSSLVASFLASSEDIQQIMFPEIIDFTLNMLKQPTYQKELCNAVLNVTFSTLNSLSQSEQYESIAFSLLRGWLDILISKSSPKPAENYNKLPDKVFCKLNAQGASTLFINLGKYLWNSLNLGSRDGAHNSSEFTLLKLQIAEDLLRLLVSSESTSNLLAIGELFANFKKHSGEIKTAVQYYLEWFLLNRANDSNATPSTDSLKSITEDMLKLFQIIGDYQEVSKVAIAALISGCKKMDQTLLKLQPAHRVSTYTLLQYNSRTCSTLEQLFDLWVTNDAIASYVAFEVKGFEYLLDRMGVAYRNTGGAVEKVTSTTKPTSTLDSLASLLEGSDYLEQLSSTKEGGVKLEGTTETTSKDATTTSTTQEEDPKEEEIANKLTIINLPGQSWAGITPDWSINKKGVRARIMYFQMNGNFHNEYCLLFSLERVVELKQIRIGFNTVWTDHTDKVLGVPGSVIVEGGTSQNDLSHIATLEPINDEGYSNFSVKVFHKNFQHIQTQSPKSLEECLESLGNKRVSYLKFRFRRPVVTFIEGLSLLSNKIYKNIAVSISFISIAGFDVKKLPNANKKLMDAQENSALQVISKLCNNQFTETLGTLANEKNVINKIRSSFDNLTNLLMPHESWLAPVFLAIASHNPEMGDWIITKFLDLSKSREHAKLVGDIILIDNEHLFERLARLNNFVLTETKRISSLGSKNESLSKFNSLVPFIEVLCTAARSISRDLIEKSSSTPQTLNFGKEELDAIIHSFEAYSTSTHNKVLIKLLVLYLYTPAPFVISDPSLLKYALEKLWKAVRDEGKPIYYEMLGPVVIGSNASAKWFITHVEEVISDLIEKLENLGSNELRNLRHAFILLCTISYHELIKKKISQGGWHLKFYHALKNKEESVGSSGATIRMKPTLKEIDSDMLQLAVEFLKNVSLGYPATEEEIIKALVADLETLEAKKDISFINNLFVPLLNAEANVPVCLHPYDPQSKRTVIGGKQLPSSAPTQQVTEPLKSEILNKDQTETLLKTVQHFTSASGLYRKIKDLPWELAMANKNDGENLVVAVREKMSKQGPFLIIMEGTNAGKKCYVGVFCSQNMAEIPEDIDTGFDKEYPIPMSDDNFIFYYEDDYRLHFPIPSFPNQTDFGQFRTFYDGGGVLSFFYNNTERVFISFISSQTSYVDIDLYDMKPMQQDLNQAFPSDIPAEFVFKSAEYWVLKTNTNTPLAQKNKKGKINVLNNVLCPQWYNPHQPFNYFRATPVYNIPVSVNVQKLVEITLNSDINVNSKLTQEVLNPTTTLADLYDFVTNDQSTNGIIDIEFDVLQYSERQLTKKEIPQVTEGLETDESLNYKPVMSIFDTFERNGGVERILELALKSLIKWKDKDKSKRWFTWVQELSSFSSLPIFFGLFMKSKACMDLLFQVIVGAPDTDKVTDSKNPKKWEEEEQKAVRLAYQILANVFSVNTDAKLREFAIQKNFFTRILDRIAIISKESRRKWVDDKETAIEEQEKDSPELKEKGDSDKKLDEEDYKKKVVKKKGVGYASDNTGQNQRWNVSEYVQSKKARNEQLQGMIEILHNFINVKEWHPSKKILNEICESALLPLLEAAFRSASLLEMAKEAELNQSYLKLTRAIAHHRGFIPCLLELDPHYQPTQKDSIYKLLSQLKELAQIFLNCLTASDKDASAPNQKLATNIIETYKIVDEALQSDEDLESDDGEGEILDLLSQPLAVAYRNLLQNLRFDYVNMKDVGTSKFKHHYASYITNNTPPQPKMVRLAQELADLSTALPIEHTNSIFVRVDESRVDVMKALVMGAAGTPYAHGAYEFDVFFDDSYPNAPPKVNLTTTGAGKVRFNPNLYSCGKVCLSLLGTWRGNASENWDPKLSTLLQVLVSIQAIIMAEDVYFNEPGFEGEAGTEEGEKKNEAYSNIVRYCNIRYAMIDQMRNPPKGFETVIRRHFYLKKDEILEEVNKWVKYAEHRDASYTGLINDHNPSWCSEFKSSKTKYKDMIKTAITELEAEFAKLPAPSGRDLHQKVLKRKEKKAEKVNINAGVANLEDIDVSYDKEGGQKNKAMNINDEDVKDRWSRYIGAMGLDAVTKQANASIFMSGLGALGVEIAKNIVLSGVNRFTIHDKAKTTFRDLSGQFFLAEEDVGKNRAQASLNKIQQLNYYVNVDTALLDQPLPKEEAEIDKLLKGYTLVILSETDYETLVAINKYCRKNHIHFITTDLYGPFSRVFNDFGDEFVVVDKNGEEVQEVMLGKITNEEQGVVSLLPGHTHKLEDGDEVLINGVDGMQLISKETEDKPTSINGTKHKVQVINASSFKIGDTRGYTPYVGNGLAKQLKTPVLLKFQSFEESVASPNIPFDPNMLMHDFLKINHPYILHIAFEAFDQFTKKYERLPKPWDLPDSEGFLQLATEAAAKVSKDYNHKEDARFEFVIRRFSFTCQGVFAPLAAFLGGFVAQEAIKAITQKFMPTKQLFYTDCYEVIPDLPESKSEWDIAIDQLEITEKKHRSDGLRICVGAKLLQTLQYTNLFMVGSGAIGCELLKNYAMLGLGTGEPGKYGHKEGGKIILTDPDVIEVSNLTRQFLFREKHLRKPKSQTAAAAAIQMNKELKGHIIARLDKVHDGTANIFTDKFFEDLTVVTNALDNVQARRYVDMRCVNAKTPLLESGTLGPKGHVQVIIPYKTESYGSQEDPKEDAEIPHCTLKMFPEETLHCVEWARDKFGKLFTQRPKGLNKVVEDPNFQVTGSTELKTLTEAVTLLKKRPLTFDDCIRYARIKFQKYFVNDIRQLLYTYPLDAKTKEGRPFWSLPKRPPTEILFDPKNPLHINFIAACACLRAKVFDIPIPKDARKDSEKAKMAEEAAKVKVPDFKPSQEKAQEINAEVDKEASKQATGEEGEDEETPVNEAEELLKDLKAFATTLSKDKEGKVKCCSPEEFEKDNDQNFHIDFISSIANCRASNYKLEPMDWLTVKIKAGRIIPALATTTASVAGLQTVELCKLLKNCKVEDMKNAFLSLAVPIMALSEPAAAPVTKLTEKLSVNLWDRWDVTLPRDATLKDLFDYIEKTYDLIPKDVTYGSQAIYFHALMDIPGKEKEKEKRIKSKLEELLNLDKEDKYADLNVMCSKKEDNQILKGVPPVRVILGSTESPTKKE